MKIAVIGASGKVGSLILEEAKERGNVVTAIVRNKSKLKVPADIIVEKDLFDLSYDDLKDFDVIVDAFGVWQPEQLSLHKKSLEHLANILSGKNNRLLVVGGAGSLFVDKEHKVRLVDTQEFPAEYRPLSLAMGEGFNFLKDRKDVQWTYLSPSAEFLPNGEKTGKYVLGEDNLLANSHGKSVISYADYANAMVDEIENGQHIQKRFTVVSKN